jgi:hypothetical protein
MTNFARVTATVWKTTQLERAAAGRNKKMTVSRVRIGTGQSRVGVTKRFEHGEKFLAVLLMALLSANFGFAEETAFRGVKLADAKGKQADASLIFSDNSKNVVVRAADRDVATIPYDQIDKVSYEYTKNTESPRAPS